MFADFSKMMHTYFVCQIRYSLSLSPFFGLFFILFLSFQSTNNHNLFYFKIQDEVANVLDFIRSIYGIFGFQFELFLSTRPEDYMGDLSLWEDAEKVFFFFLLLYKYIYFFLLLYKYIFFFLQKFYPFLSCNFNRIWLMHSTDLVIHGSSIQGTGHFMVQR